MRTFPLILLGLSTTSNIVYVVVANDRTFRVVYLLSAMLGGLAFYCVWNL